MTDRFWSCGSELELGDYTLRRSFPVHFHQEAVVAVVMDGTELLAVDRELYRLEPGCIAVVEPERAHYNFLAGRTGGRCREVYVDPELMRRSGVALPTRLRSHLLRDPIVARRLTELHETLKVHNSEEYRVEAAREVADVFNRMPSLDDARYPHVPAGEAARILRTGWSERLSWLSVAKEVGMSASALARAFRRHYGMPPHSFQTQIRIANAKRLIRRGDGIARVAVSCGFVDQSHFTRVFERYVGQTPGRFASGQQRTTHADTG